MNFVKNIKFGAGLALKVIKLKILCPAVIAVVVVFRGMMINSRSRIRDSSRIGNNRMINSRIKDNRNRSRKMIK